MKKYPIGGIAVGIFQVVDACILFLNRGLAGGATLALSGLEFVWAIVSLVVLIRTKSAPTRILASLFFGYNALGWLISIFVIDPTAPIVVPIGFVVFGGLFGLAYAAGSFYVARQP